MSDSVSLFRSLIIFGVCLPLAVLLGYLSATPWDRMSSTLMILVVVLLTIPLFLRWHHLWLIAAWNMQAVMFFLPGRPSIGMAMCAISLLISVLQHIVNRNERFIQVPTLTKPMIFLAVLVLVTAQLTGGIGLSVAGGSNIGGKRYLWMLGAVAGYFAISAHRIPPSKVQLYVVVFFLSALTSVVANLASFVGPSPMYYMMLLIPPESLGPGPQDLLGPEQINRYGGVATAATAGFSTMLAFYGINGIFNSRKPWRLAFFILFVVAGMFGGFRSILIGFTVTFILVFWLEGLMSSRLLPVMLLCAVFAAVLVVPFANKLPLSVQRSLSFVPGLSLNSAVEDSARGSTDWRIGMWKEVLPDVPQYLLIGKGYSINPAELERAQVFGRAESTRGAALAGDYHSGPLSVIMPFGIPGVVAFFWLIAAGLKVLHNNYLYGAPVHKRINTFLLATFITKVVFFLVIFGSFYSDLAIFAGYLGLSVSVNGGMLRPAPAPKRSIAQSHQLPARAYAARSKAPA